jgi:acetyl esterase/lipase
LGCPAAESTRRPPLLPAPGAAPLDEPVRCRRSGAASATAPCSTITLVGKAGVREGSERDQRFGPTFASTSWYWNHHVGGERGADPRASVLLDTNMASAPAALITAGTPDTFCEECVAYGHQLSDSGVKVQISEYPRLTHGYTAHGWMPSRNRTQLAYRACMDTLANVRVLAYS